LYEDDSEEALWYWELINTNLLPAFLKKNF
jgi:hypothetical protein